MDDPWDDTDFTLPEQGYPGPQPPKPGEMPPGGGRWAIPDFLSFSAIVRSAARAFLYSTDEALRDSQKNALAMRRDPVLLGALRGVQRPIAQLSWHITPDDETDPAEAEAAKMMEYIIKRTPRFQKLKMQLLEAIWFGKYASELTYEWRSHKGEQKLFARDFTPVNGDKLRFKWDGTPGVLVSAQYPGEKTATDWGLCHFLTPEERVQYIVHEHEPDDSDWTEPEMAGSLHGVGVRGRLYWLWWLKQQVFAQLMNYIHRFANGLTIFYYQAGNPQAKKEAEIAARQQFSNTALLYPRWPSERPDVNGVERLEVGTANSQLLWNLIDGYFDPIFVRYIQGQVLSSHAEPTGMGSKVADLQGDTLDGVIKYHAIDLQETMQTDYVNILYAYNAPGVTPGMFEFEIDSPDAQALMEYGQQLFEWGVPMDEDQVYKISQWSKPKPGNGIVTQLGAMQPTSAMGAPQGVPVTGGVGPQGQPGQMDPNMMAAMQQQGQGVPPQPGQAMAMSRRGKRDKAKNLKFVHEEREKRLDRARRIASQLPKKLVTWE